MGAAPSCGRASGGSSRAGAICLIWAHPTPLHESLSTEVGGDVEPPPCRRCSSRPREHRILIASALQPSRSAASGTVSHRRAVVPSTSGARFDPEQPSELVAELRVVADRGDESAGELAVERAHAAPARIRALARTRLRLLAFTNAGERFGQPLGHAAPLVCLPP